VGGAAQSQCEYVSLPPVEPREQDERHERDCRRDPPPDDYHRPEDGIDGCHDRQRAAERNTRRSKRDQMVDCAVCHTRGDSPEREDDDACFYGETCVHRCSNEEKSQYHCRIASRPSVDDLTGSLLRERRSRVSPGIHVSGSRRLYCIHVRLLEGGGLTVNDESGSGPRELESWTERDQPGPQPGDWLETDPDRALERFERGSAVLCGSQREHAFEWCGGTSVCR
jgi:hypothetical protein